jgi:multiple sugar transport system substrate-binding protein
MDQQRSKGRDLTVEQREKIEAFARSRMDRRRLVGGAVGGAAALSLGARTRRAGAAGARGFTPGATAAARAVLQATGDSAEAAVAAAQAFSGSEITIVWEEALQAQDPTVFSGPMWEELTGIKVNVVGKPFGELFSSQVAEAIGGTGAYDVLTFPPAWTADFVAQEMLQDLGPFIDQYMNKADLEDYHPLYRDLMNFGGSIYGIFDDGDVIILYYRKDLFEDPATMEAYQTQHGTPLAPPATWEEYDQIQAFFTERGGGDAYGGASQRAAGQVFGWFTEEFRNRGGRFFDETTMDATLDSEAGVTTLTRMVESNKTMPPGVETFGFGEVLTAWMTGQIAMIGGTWPPIGRWSEGTTDEQLAWVPATTVAGKVGYSVMPMGHSLHNAGFSLGISTDSENAEAAYLFVQWLTSPTISLQRVMLPYALRDPYRLSHFASEEYRGRWATAPDYLDTLQAAADGALLDLIVPGAAEYNTAIDQAVTAAQAGTDPAEALAGANAAFDEITDRIGREAQTAAYAEYLKLKGAYY